MALPIRRRWVWLLGLFALLVILTYGLARLTDEPQRRYMEYRVNQRLTGYTVQMRALHVHPWNVAFDLENATILQDANPDPPVANITKLTVSVDWRGLIHRRIVADITSEEPEGWTTRRGGWRQPSRSTPARAEPRREGRPVRSPRGRLVGPRRSPTRGS